MKKFSKILAMVMVALMMMSVVAFADAAIGNPTVEDKVVTVKLTGLTAGEEATILVVNDIKVVEDAEVKVELASLANTDIVYIDQLTVAEDGTVTFTLDASKTVVNADGKQFVDIYCGYTNMNVAAGPLTCADLLINPVEAPEFIYGDVDNDGEITAVDAGLILSKSVDSTVVFPCGNDAVGNVDGDVDDNGNPLITAVDAGLVLTKSVESTLVFPVENK